MSTILVSKRSSEEIAALEKEHGHILMAMDDFSLLLSPLGALWVDKQHPDYVKIIEQCIIYCRMFGDSDKVSEYENLLKAVKDKEVEQ